MLYLKLYLVLFFGTFFFNVAVSKADLGAIAGSALKQIKGGSVPSKGKNSKCVFHNIPSPKCEKFYSVTKKKYGYFKRGHDSGVDKCFFKIRQHLDAPEVNRKSPVEIVVGDLFKIDQQSEFTHECYRLADQHIGKNWRKRVARSQEKTKDLTQNQKYREALAKELSEFKEKCGVKAWLSSGTGVNYELLLDYQGPSKKVFRRLNIDGNRYTVFCSGKVELKAKNGSVKTFKPIVTRS